MARCFLFITNKKSLTLQREAYILSDSVRNSKGDLLTGYQACFLTSLEYHGFLKVPCLIVAYRTCINHEWKYLHEEENTLKPVIFVLHSFASKQILLLLLRLQYVQSPCEFEASLHILYLPSPLSRQEVHLYRLLHRST